MKKVYVSGNSEEVGLLKGVLENEGIGCTVHNDALAIALGDVPPQECWRELWVNNDEDAAEAQKVIDNWLQPEASEVSPWKCAGCGETVPGQFSACWSCGAVRPEEPEAQDGGPAAEVEFRYAEDEYARAQRWHYTKDVPVKFWFCCALFFAGMGASGGDLTSLDVLLSLGISFTIILALVVLVYVLPAAAGRGSTDTHDTFTTRFSDEGVDIRSSFDESHWQWDQCRKLIVTMEFYFLYFEDGHSAIPRRAFDGPEHEEAVQTLFEREIVDIDSRV